MAIRNGLQSLARPWNRRRALNVFLDKAALEVTPGLREALRQDLADTEWLILLLSPRSAASQWVAAEIEAWTAAKPVDRILLVHTDGELVWGDGDFDFDVSTAAPDALRGRYREEPLWLDLRPHRDQPDLDIRTNPAFRDDLATLAAPIHGRSKEDIVGEDLAQFRRARRLRRAAVAGLATLTLAAVAAGGVAFVQRNDAVRQARRAESRALAAEASRLIPAAPDLAALVALESLRVADTGEARGALLAVVGTPTRFEARFREHTGRVTAAAIGDGLAATGDEHGAIVVWSLDGDVVPHTRVAAFDGPVAGVAIVAGAPGPFVQAVAESGRVGTWTLDGEPAGDGDALGLEGAALGAGHVAGWRDGALTVHELVAAGSALQVAAVARGDEPARHLEFGAADRLLAWVSEGGVEADAVTVWDWQAGEPRRIETGTDITSLAIEPAGSRLAIGELTGTVRIVDGNTLGTVATFGPTASEPTALAFGPDGSHLVSAHSNGDVAVWPLGGEPSRPPDELRAHSQLVSVLAVGTDGRLVSGSDAGEAIWWRPAPQARLGRPYPSSGDLPRGAVLGAAFVEDGRVASVDVRGRAIVVDLDTGVGRLSARGGVGALDAAAGLVVLAGGTEIHVQPPDAAAPSTVITHSLGAVFDVEIDDAGRRVAAVGGGVGIWDAGSGELLAQPALPDAFLGVRVAFGASHLWVGGLVEGEGPAVLGIALDSLTVTLGPVVIGGRAADLTLAMAESPDGTLLLTGGTGRRIAAWDTASLRPVGAPFAGRSGAITDLEFVDGGTRVLSADGDEGVGYWDVASRRLIATLAGPADGLQSLDVSPDGALLAATGQDGRVWTWRLGLDGWAELGCELAGRNMYADEWARYGTGEPVEHCPARAG